MSKHRVKTILQWFQSELERSFTKKEAYLLPLERTMLGKAGFNFGFNDAAGLSVGILIWDSGVVDIGVANVISGFEYMYYIYVPDDHSTKIYPAESEKVLVDKINELLSQLHKDTPSLALKVPDDIA